MSRHPGQGARNVRSARPAHGPVQFGGIVREACLEYVPETQIGEYVLVHVGFAISRVDEAEAERTYQALRDLDQLTELESPVVDEIGERDGTDVGIESVEQRP